MAQVYQFVDDNGVTRLFAEIVPDPAGTPFNGGTITQPLLIHDTVAASTQSKALDITDPNHADSELWVLLTVDGSGNETVELNLAPHNDGVATVLVSDDNFDGQASLSSESGLAVVARSTLAANGAGLSVGTNTGRTQIWRDGHIVLTSHAAPADNDLAAGQCALWFDQTNGAGKLMVKAKTANGTVATGSVTLS